MWVPIGSWCELCCPRCARPPYSTPSRIIWTSSVEAFSKYYDVNDYECLNVANSPLPYESVKYQCELAAFGLDDALQTRRMRTQPGTPMEERPSFLGMSTVGGIRACVDRPRQRAVLHRTASLVFHQHRVPCQVNRNHAASSLIRCGSLDDDVAVRCVVVTVFVVMSFYMARWVGSPHHPIDPFKGAVSVSHACLAPQPDPKKRYGSRTDFWDANTSASKTSSTTDRSWEVLVQEWELDWRWRVLTLLRSRETQRRAAEC